MGSGFQARGLHRVYESRAARRCSIFGFYGVSLRGALGASAAFEQR